MLNLLRKAGQGILDFDQKYATKVQDLIHAYLPPKVDTAAMILAGAPLSQKVKLSPGDNELLARAAQAGMITSGAAVRYGIPLAGAAVLSDVIGRSYDALSEVPVFSSKEQEEEDQNNLMIRYAPGYGPNNLPM